MIDVNRVVKYGVSVWENPAMDYLRKKECLCMNCSLCGKDTCLAAKEGYELCKKYNIAFAVTRCPDFIDMEV